MAVELLLLPQEEFNSWEFERKEGQLFSLWYYNRHQYHLCH